MSAALPRTHGVARYEPGRAFDGYTLFALMYGRNVWLIDMRGVIVHRWRVENLPGNCGQIVELDWDGNPVWEYLNPFYHEHPIFGTSNMVFRCVCNGASHPGICDADLVAVVHGGH